MNIRFAQRNTIHSLLLELAECDGTQEFKQYFENRLKEVYEDDKTFVRLRIDERLSFELFLKNIKWEGEEFTPVESDWWTDRKNRALYSKHNPSGRRFTRHWFVIALGDCTPTKEWREFLTKYSEELLNGKKISLGEWFAISRIIKKVNWLDLNAA